MDIKELKIKCAADMAQAKQQIAQYNDQLDSWHKRRVQLEGKIELLTEIEAQEDAPASGGDQEE